MVSAGQGFRTRKGGFRGACPEALFPQEKPTGDIERAEASLAPSPANRRGTNTTILPASEKKIGMKTPLHATAGFCAAALALVLTAGANATPMTLTLSAEDMTTLQVYTSTFTDVGQGTPNLITVAAGTTGAVAFSGESSTSTVGAPNTLITSALTVTNTSTTDPYQLTASLVGMNFIGPDNQVSLTGSGTWFETAGSIMKLAFYDDSTDAGLATAAQQVGTYTSRAALNPTSSFSYSPGTKALASDDVGLFSMTETWTYVLAPGGELISRGQTETKSELSEPASMLLLGVGLTGVCLARLRTMRRSPGAGH